MDRRLASRDAGTHNGCKDAVLQKCHKSASGFRFQAERHPFGADPRGGPPRTVGPLACTVLPGFLDFPKQGGN